MTAVIIKNLVKTYRGKKKLPPKTALRGIDLEIPKGAVFGLLGPNGAGKSTIINIMAGLVIKTSGSVTIWGHDIDEWPRRARAAIGVVPQELNIDPFFTPRALLDLQAGLYGVPSRQRRTEDILAAMGLSDKANAYARTLSGGMRRRLMVGKAMVHNPPILVLDEPTAGVDVELRQQLWAYVRQLNEAGTTVLLTTHYLAEAEALCDRIAIIGDGRVLANDTKEALLSRIDDKELTLTLARPVEAVPPALAAFSPVLIAPNRITIKYHRSQSQIAQILSASHAAKLEITDLSTHETNLEDIFLDLVRRAPPENTPSII